MQTSENPIGEIEMNRMLRTGLEAIRIAYEDPVFQAKFEAWAKMRHEADKNEKEQMKA